MVINAVSIKDVLVIGLGEIGSAVKKLIEEKTEYSVDGLDKDPTRSDYSIKQRYDVIHICFPEKDLLKFCTSVNEYWYKLYPKYMIIHSTISLSTAKWLENCYWDTTKVLHVPVRGKHGNIKEDLQKFQINPGPVNSEKFKPADFLFIRGYLSKILTEDIMFFSSCKETALAKLASVVWFGLNLSFVQELKIICDNYGIDLEQAYTQYFCTDSTGIYEKSFSGKIHRIEEIKRPIFVPSVVGGKCVIQDTELLKKQSPEMCEWILKNNEMMKYDN